MSLLEDGCKCDERRCLKRLIQKLLQRWRRCGGAAAETGCTRWDSEHERETGAHACGRAARCQDKGCGTRAAAGRPGGASRTQDRQPSPPIGGVRGDRRRRTRRGLLAPTAGVVGTGQGPTRRGQAEDHAKASWRRRAGAMGGGSTASFRCRRILRITSPCVMAAMIRSDPR